ncbi:hypothetical protein S7335_969 [Synechococcus sp. PCC 7335]|uniref:hypothetical protein n=1 Tax=Synechococcus sp. (strain ATCC 29403 / PCC 7335) TaxID=91464 RepID=UPI00017EC826|nr:hypothetical protein [Synechococcus sp. PCC 7335]EDX82668.1 hypothetical protein S7335_969 [Synechococcus sp. PCC 7335]
MNAELQQAIELAQLYDCVIVNLTGSSMDVLFDDKRLAKAYTRRVSTATNTLIAQLYGLTVTVEIQE